MSLFLGQIHYWLYNKILWFEGIEKKITQMAVEDDPGFEQFVNGIYEKYGEPTNNKKLEDIIDTSNIHGWLQNTITSAELRQAALVTELINRDSQYKDRLTEIFIQQGQSAAKENKQDINIPEDIFNELNDYILEGMPCDRVNEVLVSNENEFSWKTTTCLHKPHWDKVKGDVENFYTLREIWISAFIKTISPDFTYEKSEDGLNRIIRK